MKLAIKQPLLPRCPPGPRAPNIPTRWATRNSRARSRHRQSSPLRRIRRGSLTSLLKSAPQRRMCLHCPRLHLALRHPYLLSRRMRVLTTNVRRESTRTTNRPLRSLLVCIFHPVAHLRASKCNNKVNYATILIRLFFSDEGPEFHINNQESSIKKDGSLKLKLVADREKSSPSNNCASSPASPEVNDQPPSPQPSEERKKPSATPPNFPAPTLEGTAKGDQPPPPPPPPAAATVETTWGIRAR